MKYKYLITLSLASIFAHAGDYSTVCYEKGLKKYEVYDCLTDMEEHSVKAVEKTTREIQHLASENEFSFIPVSDKQIERINFAFDTYVDQQCKLIGSSLKGTGSGQELQDCKIRLTKQRLKDVNYLLTRHYKTENPSKEKEIDDEKYTQLISGAWSCLIEQGMDGVSVTIDTEDSYVDNGRFNSFGSLQLSIESEGISIDYNLAGTGSWNVKNGKLYQTIEDIKIVNLTAPEFDSVFNLEEMFPKNISESSTITSIDNKHITVKSDIDGTELTCSKKV